MSDLYPTKSRLDLLRAVGNRRVIAANATIRRVVGDLTPTRPGSGVSTINRRCDAAIREMEHAGWVRLGADGTYYELTPDGAAVLAGGAR